MMWIVYRASDIFLTLAVVLPLIALALRLRKPRPIQTLCPGASLRGWKRWTPARWLIPNRICGYDLGGLTPRSTGFIVCPECGREVRSTTDLVARAPGSGLFRVALCCAVATAGCRAVPYVWRGRWIKYTPTDILILIDPALFGQPRRVAHRELTRRAHDQQMSERQKQFFCSMLVSNLGSDTTPGNASWSSGLLWDLLETAVPKLETALRSKDWQRRQLAASLLRVRWASGEHPSPNPAEPAEYQPRSMPPYTPPDDLFLVTVEGLRDDDLPYERTGGHATWTFNACEGLRYLSKTPERSEPFLEQALESDDAQQRAYAAAAITRGHRPRLRARAIAELVEHLRDNTLDGDALLAAEELLDTGTECIPALQRVLTSEDDQQRGLATYLLLAIPSHASIYDARWAVDVIARGTLHPIFNAASFVTLCP